MNEASKTLFHYKELLQPILQIGSVLDIGAGDDPVVPWAEPFDKVHGDAQFIDIYGLSQYHCVFSSHCLEHMNNPVEAIQNWWKLVLPGGYLILIVPDEDLYEQGSFPSIFNSDHKHTFTISKSSSWCKNSINVLDLVKTLEDSTIIEITLQDEGYDRKLITTKVYFRKLYFMVRAYYGKIPRLVIKFMNFFSLWPVDQTSYPDFRLAQILTIIRKNPAPTVGNL